MDNCFPPHTRTASRALPAPTAMTDLPHASISLMQVCNNNQFCLQPKEKATDTATHEQHIGTKKQASNS